MLPSSPSMNLHVFLPGLPCGFSYLLAYGASLHRTIMLPSFFLFLFFYFCLFVYICVFVYLDHSMDIY